MKKLFLLACLSCNALIAAPMSKDITCDIPEIVVEDGFEKIDGVAQYKEADWSNVIGIARGISVEQAKEIAANDPDITFFFYTTAHRLVLERTDGTFRRFGYGDTVFFTGEPWWGTAPGLADGYVKR